ncbi:MAG: 4-hydroxy-tetrahydrodipicolinate synthase [Spirochaetales bacterium]|nr:4-hydroxy-tetrahydrodipicolinate synthase [Spirochaetales bacterium]
MLKGVITALITPFNNDGSIDEAALRDLIDMQIAGGVSGLLPMGTTGESPTVSHAEHTRIIEITVEQTNKRVPVIAGTGSNATSEAIELTRSAQKMGVDYSLQVAPYYNKPNQEGLYRHFSAIAENSDIPQIIYNIPGRSGINIDTETTLKLAQNANVKGVKEASGNIKQMMDILAQRPEGFYLFSGDDNLTYPLLALGSEGVISVASNIIPGLMSEFVKYGLEGNLEKSREMHYKLLPLFNSMFVDTNPIPVKYALTKTIGIKEVYRLPLCKMSDDKKAVVDKALKDLDLI